MRKIFGLLFAILLFTNVALAVNGSGKLSIITDFKPKKAGVPAGYQLTFDPHAPETGPNLFVTDENVAEWKVGDDVSFMDPDEAHSCETKDKDTILINSSRAEWVCAVAVVKH